MARLAEATDGGHWPAGQATARQLTSEEGRAEDEPCRGGGSTPDLKSSAN
jgi:hypothetical protein